MARESASVARWICRCGTGLAAAGLLAARLATLATPFALAAGCSKATHDAPSGSSGSSASASALLAEPPPVVLYLPDAAPPSPVPSMGASQPDPVPRPPRATSAFCPPEMVYVRQAFCIDRYEASLVDGATGRPLSPYYHPTPLSTRREYERWQQRRLDATCAEGRAMPVPPPPEWALTATRFEPLAVSTPNAVPNGYLSGQIAAAACERAGKRLCTASEWVTACRGQQNRKFPYGGAYVEGRCNVCRATHPARFLHGDPSQGHLDPRLNQVCEGEDPLLRLTGAAGCESQWGTDAVVDMVGNLDEWVEDPDGTFVGGFYARSTREGCDARVEVHAYDYYDYSLGARCCQSARFGQPIR